MSNSPLGYCTNVHAASDLPTLCDQLAEHASAVRQQLNVDPLPVGLWLPDHVTRQLAEPASWTLLVDTLQHHQLSAYTLNGFPFGDFHQKVVKYNVYRPAWWERRRLEYTLRLAEILARLRGPGQSGTISTLPLGWPTSDVKPQHLELATQHLLDACEALQSLARQTGCEICLCLEPEPGCVLETSQNVVDFFEGYLRPAASQRHGGLLDHIGVCHDVCHAVVMHEQQQGAIGRYLAAGIRIAKVQLSSCVRVDFGQLPDADRSVAFLELRRLVEQRYLHQTTVGQPILDGHAVNFHFFDDLPTAIGVLGSDSEDEWRVHFHVPVHLARAGALQTSQSAIIQCLEALASHGVTADLEVETYAWNVLPSELRADTLAHDIADELRWCEAARARVVG